MPNKTGKSKRASRARGMAEKRLRTPPPRSRKDIAEKRLRTPPPRRK